MIRILTAWAGSPPCGTVADLPDALAVMQVGRGWAEAVAPAAAPETAMVAPGERAVPPKGKARGGRV